MKIQNVRLYILQAPLRTPFKTALRTVDRIEDLVVALETDTGEVGWGEAPATAPITGDTLPSIACAIQDFIVPRILGLEIERLEQATSAVQGALVHNTSAKAAVDIALHDLYGKRWGAPLWSLLGGLAQRGGDRRDHQPERPGHHGAGRPPGGSGRVPDPEGQGGHRRERSAPGQTQ